MTVVTFIMELSPWIGGFYERLIGIVKRTLRKTIGTACLTYEQLATILSEAQAVVNTRPLTHVGEDINSFEINTPQHFLSLNPKTGFPPLVDIDVHDDDLDYTKNVTNGFRLVEIWKRGHNQFWEIWKRDYLLSLREKTQTHLKSNRIQSKETPFIGDIVLIKESGLPRGLWKIGRLEALLKRSDDEITGASVMLPSHKIINRPLSLLYPIECK